MSGACGNADSAAGLFQKFGNSGVFSKYVGRAPAEPKPTEAVTPLRNEEPGQCLGLRGCWPRGSSPFQRSPESRNLPARPQPALALPSLTGRSFFFAEKHCKSVSCLHGGCKTPFAVSPARRGRGGDSRSHPLAHPQCPLLCSSPRFVSGNEAFPEFPIAKWIVPSFFLLST